VTALNGSRAHTATTDRVDRRQPKTDDTPARRRTAQLIADAVIASYIHDISQPGAHSIPAAPQTRRTQAKARAELVTTSGKRLA
jgi:hypothetical protein